MSGLEGQDTNATEWDTVVGESASQGSVYQLDAVPVGKTGGTDSISWSQQGHSFHETQ
jgi:hypothetical protein